MRHSEVVETRPEIPRAKCLFLEVPGWEGHKAGQHMDVRLTAEDGYQAQRSYSIQPPRPRTVGRARGRAHRRRRGLAVPDRRAAGRGQAGAARTGRTGSRGAKEGGPLFGGRGIGIAPLMAIPTPCRCTVTHRPRLLFCSREDAIARLDHLSAEDGTLEAFQAHRSQLPGWTGCSRRIDREMLEEVGWPSEERPLVFVCSPTPLVEAVATVLVRLGHDPTTCVKTERFGPTGG